MLGGLFLGMTSGALRLSALQEALLGAEWTSEVDVVGSSLPKGR